MRLYLVVMAIGMAIATLAVLIPLSRPAGSRSRELLGALGMAIGGAVFLVGCFLT